MQLNNKIRLALIGGHIVECFDNTIYGFFAVMLAPIFFSSESSTSSILMAYGGFAAGFLARPFGALILGRIGDRYGRRGPLLWSMILVGIPTMIIGLIPPFEVWGIVSSFLLILCRLLQGFFYGAEFTGINLYNMEDSDKSHIGKRTGIIVTSGVFGAALATAIGAFVTTSQMPSWAWRIPFICGGLAAFTVYLLRRKLSETLDFQVASERQALSDAPVKEVFRNYKVPFVVSMWIAGLTVMPLYSCTIFGNKLFKDLGYSTSESMLLNLAAMVFDGILIIMFGRLADRIGFYRQMMLGSSLVALAALPAFNFINQAVITTMDVYMFIALLTAVGTIINGCTMPFISSFFPTNCRYSGVALSATCGGALLGGTSPLVSSLVIEWFGTKLAPGFWLASNAVLTAVGIWYMQNRYKRYSEPHSRTIVAKA
jgi:MHS family proline/betaine transporter-like MFS transporter